MRTESLEITRKEVVSRAELNRTNSKYKEIHGVTNLLEVTTEEFLSQNGFSELERAFRCALADKSRRITNFSLNFKEVSNTTIIEEIDNLSAMCPQFTLEGVLEETDSDDIKLDVLKISCKNGQTKVVIL